jgi:hypothetical protein
VRNNLDVGWEMMDTIEQLTEDRVNWISSEFARLAWSKSDGYFQKCFAAQKRGDWSSLSHARVTNCTVT